jgi:tRNA (guanine-N7-)-methyltransferase
MIDPKEFVITRKRKKYKFAKFANSPLCFEYDQWSKSAADVIEIGAGTALFSVELAARNPDKTFVAIDVKADRLQKGAYAAEEKGLTNIRFLRARADQLTDCFQPASIETIWLTFADPFPKRRSAGRRMTHPTFLKIYQSLLRKEGSFIVKHDSPEFFAWSLEQLVRSGWLIKELAFDLHESDLADTYDVKTTYEQRWIAEGRTSSLVRAVPAHSDQLV